MRGPYYCPNCYKPFSRKWNLRVHSRNRHQFDPGPAYPTDTRVAKYGFTTGYQNKKDLHRDDELSAPTLNRVKAILSESLQREELRTGQKENMNLTSLSGEVGINKILDGHVILSKNVIEGISGYLCNTCMTFDFSYIKNIGLDLTEEERHRCGPDALKRVNSIQDKNSLLSKIDVLSTDLLFGLTNSIFGHNVLLTSDTSLNPLFFEPYISGKEDLRSRGFHAHVIRLDSIREGSNYEWIKSAIVDR